MKNNLSIVRQQFAQCVFNHKIHEKAHDRLIECQKKIKWVNIVLLWLILLFIILQIKYPTQSYFSAISIGITVFEILFLFAQKEFSIEEKAIWHKKIAIQYLWLRDKYKNFIVDIMNGLDDWIASSKRDLLQEQYQIISSLSIDTKPLDYVQAQKKLLGKTNTDEEFTRSNDEINRFLPGDLRLTDDNTH